MTITEFEADVSIGKGWQTLARHGKLTIVGGQLTLFGDNGRRIVEAPVDEVHAAPMRLSAGAGAKMTIKGAKYSVVPFAIRALNATQLAGASTRLGASAAGSAVMGVAGSAVELAGQISKIKRGRGMTRAVLECVEAAGGKVSFG